VGTQRLEVERGRTGTCVAGSEVQQPGAEERTRDADTRLKMERSLQAAGFDAVLTGSGRDALKRLNAAADISAVLRRSRLVGVSLAVGVIVLLGLPPFAMFASELAIARSLADARLTWAIGAGLLMVAIAFAALARNFGRILLGDRPIDTPEIAVPRTVAAALLIGVAASLVLGVTAGPLTGLFTTAASDVGAAR